MAELVANQTAPGLRCSSAATPANRMPPAGRGGFRRRQRRSKRRAGCRGRYPQTLAPGDIRVDIAKLDLVGASSSADRELPVNIIWCPEVGVGVNHLITDRAG